MGGTSRSRQWPAPAVRRRRLTARLSLRCAVAVIIGCGGHISYQGRHAREWIEILAGPDTLAQQQAAFALSRILAINPRERGVVPALVRAVSDTNDGVRMAAARALVGANRWQLPSEAVPGLIEALHDSAHSDVRAAAAALLSHTPAEVASQVVAELADALRDPAAEVRGAAAVSLQHLQHIDPAEAAAAAPALRQALDDPDDYVRANALVAYVSLRLPDESEDLALLRAAFRDRSALIRSRAADLLGLAGAAAAPAVAELTRALDDSSPEVRRASASALGSIGAPAQGAVPSLRRRLNDSDLTVRREAREALRRLEASDGR